MPMKKRLCVSAVALLTVVASATVDITSSHCLSSVASTNPTRAAAMDFLVCSYCSAERFRLLNTNKSRDDALCDTPRSLKDPSSHIADSILNYARVQGHFWGNASMATRALAHLLRYMPIRDTIKLMQNDDRFLDLILENIRLSILVRMSGPDWATSTALVTDDDWLDNVLPYAFLDEKRDVNFGWRRRFHQLFAANVSKLKSSS